MEFQDQLGRKIMLSSRPERIVSLVPSQTELLVDLGLEKELVGITKFCVHPKALRKVKKVVGGTKEVHLDKIKELKPDIILCNKEENTKEMVEELETIAPVHVSDVNNLDEAEELIAQYGKLFGKGPLADTFISSIERKKEELKKLVEERPKLKVAYFIWNRPLMAVGVNTFIDKMLELNGFENVIWEERYPEISVDQLKKRNPDLLLLSSEPFPFREKHREIFSEMNSKVLFVDGEYFSWYGSRLIDAMDYFKKLQDQLSILS
ncbi:ABC transporter substrate-binding protein [Salegentibacter chungangensis]|uniref:ABC transporter substrate-binding protein n=1 Tax=Salegentibacter chungangensis TaxID=1335724 RepID=A0ABW3NN98_9FLAO